MSTLDDWLDEAARAVGVAEGAVDATLRAGLLDLTREVAHGITRVAGPLTTYVAGIAVGAGMAPAEVVRLLTDAAVDHIGAADSGSEG